MDSNIDNEKDQYEEDAHKNKDHHKISNSTCASEQTHIQGKGQGGSRNRWSGGCEISARVKSPSSPQNANVERVIIILQILVSTTKDQIFVHAQTCRNDIVEFFANTCPRHSFRRRNTTQSAELTTCYQRNTPPSRGTQNSPRYRPWMPLSHVRRISCQTEEV